MMVGEGELDRELKSLSSLPGFQEIEKYDTGEVVFYQFFTKKTIPRNKLNELRRVFDGIYKPL